MNRNAVYEHLESHELNPVGLRCGYIDGHHYSAEDTAHILKTSPEVIDQTVRDTIARLRRENHTSIAADIDKRYTQVI